MKVREDSGTSGVLSSKDKKKALRRRLRKQKKRKKKLNDLLKQAARQEHEGLVAQYTSQNASNGIATNSAAVRANTHDSNSGGSCAVPHLEDNSRVTSRHVTFKTPCVCDSRTVLNCVGDNKPISCTLDVHPHFSNCGQGASSACTSLPSGVIPDPSMYVALDCEFVGVGPRKTNALARCSIVKYNGHIVLDVYVKPGEPITDYRTRWSGIYPSDMRKAIPLHNARRMIIKAIKGKIVVGHAIFNDFKAIRYIHPRDSVRDTSTYLPLREKANFNVGCPASLKRLTLQLCGYRIQVREHCSVEDSRATMDLFKLVRVQWEQALLAEQSTCDSEGRSRRLSHTRSISESSEESYLQDHFWPTDI